MDSQNLGPQPLRSCDSPKKLSYVMHAWKILYVNEVWVHSRKNQGFESISALSAVRKEHEHEKVRMIPFEQVSRPSSLSPTLLRENLGRSCFLVDGEAPILWMPLVLSSALVDTTLILQSRRRKSRESSPVGVPKILIERRTYPHPKSHQK